MTDGHLLVNHVGSTHGGGSDGASGIGRTDTIALG